MATERLFLLCYEIGGATVAVLDCSSLLYLRPWLLLAGIKTLELIENVRFLTRSYRLIISFSVFIGTDRFDM